MDLIAVGRTDKRRRVYALMEKISCHANRATLRNIRGCCRLTRGPPALFPANRDIDVVLTVISDVQRNAPYRLSLKRLA